MGARILTKRSPLLFIKLFIRFILLIVLAFVCMLAIYQTYHPGLHLAQTEINIGVALYSDIQDGRKLDSEISKISCNKPGCLLFDAKRTIEAEYFRYSRQRTTFNFNIARPSDNSIKSIQNPRGVIDGFALIYDFILSFQNHGMNYFAYDMRLFVNVIKKHHRDYSETSIGSQKSRVGLIEWQVSDKNNYAWNLTKTLHEMGHMLGARDKYMGIRKSHYPSGYVNPEFGADRPQIYTEIMSGTRPINRFLEIEPVLAEELRFGFPSAFEMGWIPKVKSKSH